MPLLTGTSGSNRTAYGSVPSAIPNPPNIFSQLSGMVPGFTGNLAGAGNVIGSELSGNVSPGTMNALKTGAAQFGVASGMPGSGLEQNQLFGNIAGFSEGQAHRGVQDYLSQVGALGPTMTNPNLAAEISAHNADLAAAPDPRMAADQAFKDWLRGFQYTQSAGTPAGPWNAGGILGPNRGFSTTHSNWGGSGMAPPGLDSLGFPNYDMTSQQGYGTITATASPPPGGWQSPQPWNSGFATGVSNNPYFYAGEDTGPPNYNVDEG